MNHRHLLAGISALFMSAMILPGCFISDSDDNDTCEFNGNTFDAGDSFPASDGCNTCTCESGGAISCTEAACTTGCTHNGNLYQPGDTFADDCNTCTCEAGGNVSCTQIACNEPTTCEYEGTTYNQGDMFDAIDGCNTCECLEDSMVACTDMACPGDCTYNGMDYMVGESFPAIDMCNTCTCDAPGMVTCTQMMCP